MNPRQLTILAVVAVLSVGATAVVLRTNATTIASDRRGERALPALAGKANEITGLTVLDGSDKLAIERRDNAFVAADSGFPIKGDAVRDAVAGSIELTFEEARTNDPARYGDLGLADPGAAEGGKEISFRSASGDLGDIVIGNRDNSVGGPIGGVFVRLKGTPQTWLARGNVQLPPGRADWFAPLELGVKRSDIKKIELGGGGRDGVTASATAEKPNELTLENVPEKRVADTFKVSRLTSLIESFAFQDVRKQGQPEADPRRLVADTADGLRLSFTNVGDLADGWVQVTAEATNDAARDEAKALNAKAQGYDFRLPPHQVELLGWTIADLTDEQKADAHGPEPLLDLGGAPAPPAR
jgi:hypothetical protein